MEHEHGHGHGHHAEHEEKPEPCGAHDDDADAEVRRIATPSGVVVLSIFEDGIPPVFRVVFEPTSGSASQLSASDVRVTTIRPNQSEQTFEFEPMEGGLQSTVDIPEPHEFGAIVRVGETDYRVEFVEGHGHSHGHGHGHAHHE